MIELKGTVTNCKVYFSAPKSASTDIGVDLNKVHELGFDYFVNVGNDACKRNKFFTNSSRTDKAEIQIIAESIFSVIKPISNVEVEIARSYNAFQWVGFLFVCSYRKLKGLLK